MTKRIPSKLKFNRTLLLLAVGWMIVAVPVQGQILHADGPLPSFEVATIKPSAPRTVGNRIGPKADNLFSTQNATVKDLLEFAYTITSDDQVVGLSRWMSSEGYDIDAKVGDAEVAAMLKLPPLRRFDPYRLMMQSLLADRFKLKVSHPIKEIPIFELVVAKGGSKLKPSEMDSGNPPQPVKPFETVDRTGGIAGSGLTIDMLAELLSTMGELGGGGGARGRIVVDKTNMTGVYDLTLHWTPESLNPAAGATATSKWPSLFTALQEQLGLKLQPGKAPMEVLVIDHIMRPSEN